MFLLLVLTFSCCTQEPKFSEDADVMDVVYKDTIIQSADIAKIANKFYRVTDIVIHCTGSKSGKPMTMKDLNKIWKERGWSRGGYQYIIEPNGDLMVDAEVKNCLLTDKTWRYGVKDYNHSTINIAWVGGYERKDTRTEACKIEMHRLVKELIDACPSGVRVRGHNEFKGVKKSCPNFKASVEFAYLLKKE